MKKKNKKLNFTKRLQELLSQGKLPKNIEPKINKVLYKWSAPDRIAYNKDTLKMMGLGSFLFLIALYLLWVGQPLLAITVVALFFLYYAVYSIPPIKVTHSIESVGIRSMGVLYPWDNLRQFWFAEREGNIVLYVDTTLALPARLFLIANDKEEAAEILVYLAGFIPYKPLIKKQTWLDKNFNGRYIEPKELVNIELLTEAYLQASQNKNLITRKKPQKADK